MRTLADGKGKFTLLTTAPADPAAPTATELNAGIDMSCKVVASDFEWTPTDSETVSEPALCDDGNAEVLARSNYNTAFTLWRYYLEAGGVDPTDDAGFAAVMQKGTEIYGYYRKSAKAATEAWAEDDEIVLGAQVVTDWPQDPGAGGWLKFRVPCKAQRAWPWITVAPATP